MKLCIGNWRLVEYDGFPEDGAWCFVTWEGSQGEVEWSVGGYQAEWKQFYVNFGFGGAVIDEKSVVGWTLFEDAEWIKASSSENKR